MPTCDATYYALEIRKMPEGKGADLSLSNEQMVLRFGYSDAKLVYRVTRYTVRTPTTNTTCRAPLPHYGPARRGVSEALHDHRAAPQETAERHSEWSSERVRR